MSAVPRFYRNLLSELKTVSVNLDRTYFAESSLSLMATFLASDAIYEQAEELPPFEPEWDCQGMIQERTNGTIFISGAEIKSSGKGTP